MVGMRSVERSSSSNSEAGRVLRACLDLVEQLVRSSENVKAAEVETTLAVLNKAAAEFSADEASATAVVSALRNAVGRLHALRDEMKGGQVAPR
jgi:hypothetical protein